MDDTSEKPHGPTVSVSEALSERLERHNQRHLVRFADDLSPSRREKLIAQLESIDFALVERLYRDIGAATDWRALAARAQSPQAFRLSDAAPNPPRETACRAGEDALRSGHVGVIIVAGGEGSRLGFPHPKGMFPIGPVSGHCLFQVLFEKVQAIARRYATRLPVYLMTSPSTHDETSRYLDEQGWFGLDEADRFVFCQGTMPAVDAATGNILLSAPDEVALSPDGHGGMLAALARSGGMDDLARRGIERLFYCQVDNPLVALCDPEFLGDHILTGSRISTQVVAKRDASERVGVVVSIDGRTRIIEYSDLPADVASRTTSDTGAPELALWAGSTAVHAIDVDFLRQVAADPDRLPFHVARKAVAHIDDAGNLVEPRQPNAIKFERFIFDLLPAAERSIVFEVDRQAAFAPLKNADSQPADTPTTVRRQMIALHARWLRSAGAIVEEGVPVEISPLFALDAAELSTKVDRGLRITKPRLFD
jgi:UDP-N-acetylglucosamine/UDP-N-acetylgalactosamine diphosphorylase